MAAGGPAAPRDPYNAFSERVADPGPGRRLAVKDMIAVAGMLQEAGLAARAGMRASADAAVVAALRRAGWAVAGVTRSDAAGFGTMTPLVENPRDPRRAVGGSSGGAAAAVAAGLADLGLGTDTGGSGRIPAAYCELFALKPSHGRASTAGVLPFAPTFDTLALLARDVATLAAAAPHVVGGWDAAAGPADAAPHAGEGGGAARLGVPNWLEATVEPAVLAAFKRALALLPPAEPWVDPVPYEPMATAHGTIVCAEALVVHRARFAAHPAGFPEVAASGLEFAKTLTAADVAEARRVVDTARAALRMSVERVLLVLPTLPMPAAARHAGSARVRGETMPITSANIRLTLLANVAGLPVVVAPVAGLSLQFVGPFGRDEWLLASVQRLLVEARAPA